MCAELCCNDREFPDLSRSCAACWETKWKQQQLRKESSSTDICPAPGPVVKPCSCAVCHKTTYNIWNAPAGVSDSFFNILTPSKAYVIIFVKGQHLKYVIPPGLIIICYENGFWRFEDYIINYRHVSVLESILLKFKRLGIKRKSSIM